MLGLEDLLAGDHPQLDSQNRLTLQQSIEGDPFSSVAPFDVRWASWRRAKPALERFWTERVSPVVPLTELWRVHLPFALWILAQRQRMPNRLFVVGVNGPIGGGKTTFCGALKVLLDELAPSGSHCAARSLDDYYLPRAVRETPAFKAKGYAPYEGLPVRGPAGTHDVDRLLRDLQAMETARRPGDRIALPAFDKSLDDRLPEPHYVQGPMGIFLIEGWFLGARAVAPVPADAGLAAAVAQALKGYQPVFDRLDALWVFEPLPIDQIVRHRQEQERRSRSPRMDDAAIERFVDYFYRLAWHEGATSPVPPADRVTFWAKIGADRSIRDVRAGARACNL
jgi:pantothenate kinase-related protein Tda10